MSTVRYELRKEKADKNGNVPIRLVYQLKGIRAVYNTKNKVFPAAWDETNQQLVYLDKKTAKKLVGSIPYDRLLSAKEIDDINHDHSVLKSEIRDIEKGFELSKMIYSAQMVIDKLKSNKIPITKVEPSSNELFDFIDKYIDENRSSREPGSLSVYKSLKNHLNNFQMNNKRKVTFDNIDYSFFSEFQNFLINFRSERIPKGLGNITIAKLLSTLKTFLNYARVTGVQVSNRYKDFKIKKENLEVIALTNDEFETLYHYDLTNNKKLAQVRDVFCFSCATGLRYSDLAQLKREHIKKEEIRLTITKTKELLSIPLNQFSSSILERYISKHRPLPIISNQKMNDYIKELCKKAKISEPVQIVRYRGAKREEILYPKHDLISVHTGRKTFCTLSLEKGMSAEEVMKISGHKDYKSFSRYVKITDQRTKFVMNKAWG